MSAERDSETAPVLKPLPIYKGPLRPTPTQAYDFKDYIPKPKISYVKTLHQAKSALATLTQSGPLGFDLEWRPTYKKGAPENPVALVQLANYHSIVLFQVSCMQGFPSELKQILESSHIVKAGVGIQGDAKKMFRDCNVSMRNCVDLSLLARTVDNAHWAGTYNSPIGLARLIECYEYKLLLKGKVSRSDWTAVLTPKQQEYAGNDAHAGYTLYRKLESMMPFMPSLPEEAWYSFNVLGGILCDDDGLPWEPENPAYDPGPLPELKPPTEAQLQRKQKRTETRVAQQQQALSSSQVEDAAAVVSGVQPLLNPSFPISNSQPPTIYPVENRIFAPQVGSPTLNSMPSRTAASMRQVSGYHHSAGKQTTARNNSQDQRFLSTKSGTVSYPSRVNPQSTPPFPGTGKRHTPPMSEPTTARKQQEYNRRWPHPGHTSNRRLSVNTRDNLVPSTTHRGNP